MAALKREIKEEEEVETKNPQRNWAKKDEGNDLMIVGTRIE